jgi:preprotein translocase subunit SecG
MLSKILLILLIVDSLVLVASILLQAGKGGGLASTFGGVSSSADTIFGSRQAGNLLTKASWWCGGLFLGLAFLLSLASSGSQVPHSVLDQTFTPSTAPVPVTPQGGGLPLQTAPATNSQLPGTAPSTKAPATPATKTPPTPPPTTKKP